MYTHCKMTAPTPCAMCECATHVLDSPLYSHLIYSLYQRQGGGGVVMTQRDIGLEPSQPPPLEGEYINENKKGSKSLFYRAKPAIFFFFFFFEGLYF